MTRALSDSMVKACLFLLAAVAVADDATCAASSPGCPSKMQAEANTLLQTGVRIGDELAPGRTVEEEKNTYTDEATNPHKVSWMQEGMNTQQLKEKLIDNSKGKGSRDVLIQLSRFVNTLGNATKHLNSSNADNLNEVIKILRAVLYKSMNTDHTEDQKELNQAFAGITTCNTDLGKATTDNVTPLKNTMVTARSTHMTCRTEEARLETIKDGKWNEMLGHIAGISKPPSVTTWPVSPTYDTLVPYFSTGYAEWFVRQKQAFDTKNHAYVSANTNWTTSKARCDSDQTTFESDFCVYNAVLDTTCDNHDTCYISASSGANTTTARLEVTEAARKEAYKAGEEIVCRINALLANRAYSECDNLTVDTSNYSIVYPTADAKDSCVTEIETPCSNTWKDTEYNGLPSNAPSTACTPCQAPSMAPTVAPTTQPAWVTESSDLADTAGGNGKVSGATWTQSGGWTGVRGKQAMCTATNQKYTFTAQINQGMQHIVGVAPDTCCKGVDTSFTGSGEKFACLYSHSTGWDRHRGAALPVGEPSTSTWWNGTWDGPHKDLKVDVDCANHRFKVGIVGGDDFLGEMSWPASWPSVFAFMGGQTGDHIVTLTNVAVNEA